MNARTFTHNLSRNCGFAFLCASILSQICFPSSATAQAPVITEHPASQFILDCRQATFSVVATGNELRYQWFRDGDALMNATNSSHVFARATYRDDRSIFFAIVSNNDGSVTSSNAVLYVSQDPNVVFVRHAYASNDALTVFVQFSTVVTNADEKFNYLIVPATNTSSLDVQSAVYANGATTGDFVIVRLSEATPMIFPNDYNMRVENVTDECGNVIDSFRQTPILKPVQLTLARVGLVSATLTWTGEGMLQMATNFFNPIWENITNASSPYGPFPLNDSRFFRVRVW